MKAIVFGEDGQAHLRERPVPTVGAGEVLIEVDACGICGSDLHAAQPDFRPGVTMGHEFGGAIVDVGPHAGGWATGERVCVNPNGDSCSACAFCRTGDVNLCSNLSSRVVGLARDGGMAPYVAVPVTTLHRLPDAVTGRQAAWVEPLAVAIRTVRTSGIAVGEQAVVFGGGPIGLLVVLVLRAAGVGVITAVEPSAVRGALAGRCGADVVIDPRSEDVVEHFADPANAPSHAFECTGVAAVTGTALRVLRPHGVLTVTGFAREHPSYRAEDLLFKELSVRGSFIYADEFRMAIDMLARGVVDVEPLISDVRDVSDGVSAFDDLRRRDGAVKVLLSGSPA